MGRSPKNTASSVKNRLRLHGRPPLLVVQYIAHCRAEGPANTAYSWLEVKNTYATFQVVHVECPSVTIFLRISSGRGVAHLKHLVDYHDRLAVRDGVLAGYALDGIRMLARTGLLVRELDWPGRRHLGGRVLCDI